MYSLRRSCQAAVHSAPPAVNVFAAARGAHRAFSRTSACSRGALPVFLESSTPELSALLAEYNAKILLPTHLTSEQQKLVFSKAGKTKIEAEPVEITLGEVTLPLQHLDRNKLPDRFAQLRAILRTSKTSQDHENVVRLIEGIEDSKIVFKPQWKELIVRTLNRRRMHHLVLKALQRPEATGLRLTDWPLVREVFGGLHRKAAFAAVDDQAEQTAQAYRFATQIVELMENEAHHGPSIMKDGRLVQRDWRSDPAVIAVPTELAAMLAKKHGMDVAAVKKLSSRLINALKQTDYMARLDTVAQSTEALPSQFKNKVVQVSTQIRLAHDTEPIIWVWNALKLSRNVLGAEMPLAEEARQFEERAAQVIFAALKAMEPLNLRKGSNVVPRFAQDIAELVKQCES